MITENTVFILGAGASCPYGYPDGKELRKQICESFVNDSNRYFKQYEKIRSRLDGISYRAKDFTEKFQKSSTRSIDLFLARNPEFMDRGKWAIIFRILIAETQGEFREQMAKPDQDWYSHLFEKLTNELVQKDDYCRYCENKVAFITFNYDRSLEHFLCESLLNSFNGIDAGKIHEQLKKHSIIHVFGQVAGLEWQDIKLKYPYRASPYSVDVQKLADNLTIIYEKKENPELAEAHKLITAAQRIFFLGFGFAKENLEILKVPEIVSEQQQIYGTALGSTKKEIEDIRNIFPPIKIYVGTSLERGNIKIHHMDCLALLREYL